MLPFNGKEEKEKEQQQQERETEKEEEKIVHKDLSNISIRLFEIGFS